MTMNQRRSRFLTASNLVSVLYRGAVGDAFLHHPFTGQRAMTTGSTQANLLPGLSTNQHPSLGVRRKWPRSIQTRRRKKAVLEALIPLQRDDLEHLLSTGVPSALQYEVYWGRTPSERYARLLESCIVSFLGVFFSYFLSFVLGGFVATILGTLFVFWGILSPYLKAFQRNWEFLGGRQLVDPPLSGVVDAAQRGLYGSLYVGHLADVCVVEDAIESTEYDLAEFDDYTMEHDEQERWTGNPYLVRILAQDRSGRELQVHARLSEEFLNLQPGMPLCGVLLSTRPSFDRLNGITDLYVPDCACWIGDYPYLERTELEALLAQDDEIWSLLQQEGTGDFAVVSDTTRDTSVDRVYRSYSETTKKDSKTDLHANYYDDLDETDDDFDSSDDRSKIRARKRKYR